MTVIKVKKTAIGKLSSSSESSPKYIVDIYNHKANVELSSIQTGLNEQFVLHDVYGFGIKKAQEYNSDIPREYMDESVKELIERLKNRPDIAKACLEFIDKEITRPKYAKISAELTEARQGQIRERERQSKARYRQRQRAGAGAKPTAAL